MKKRKLLLTNLIFVSSIILIKTIIFIPVHITGGFGPIDKLVNERTYKNLLEVINHKLLETGCLDCVYYYVNLSKHMFECLIIVIIVYLLYIVFAQIKKQFNRKIK